MKTPVGRSWALAACTLALGSGCQTPSAETNHSAALYPVLDENAKNPNEQVEPLVFRPKPWTDAFMEKAVLVADEVLIEGPEGLLDHSATRAEPEFHARTERTLADGYLQEIRVKAANAPEIRCQLDGLQIAAGKRLRILQRPGPVAVTVRATGAAFWKEVATGKEQRAEKIELVGEVEQ